jgi:hypothetical protein
MPDNTATEHVGFGTTGTWSATDVVTLVSSVSGIYDVLLAHRLQNELQARYVEVLEKEIEDYRQFYKGYLDHPLYHDLFNVWRDALRYWRKHGQHALPPAPFPFAPTAGAWVTQAPTVREVHATLHFYADENLRLAIHRIKMGSPGGFSFTGSGELLKQFRELIKDLWYRNKQEKQRGQQQIAREQLEIIDKYLCMRREHQELNLPPPRLLRADPLLVAAVNDGVEKLKRLEESEKLLPVADNLQFLPD